jgi:valyl-tRNA synthetase
VRALEHSFWVFLFLTNAMIELEKSYNASDVENRIYKMWEESGYFNPDNLPDAANKESYTIVMPPPNANAPLHVGHALGLTIEDILIRYQRMNGKRALWIPGTDHAGFETQVVFEKKLEKEDRTRLTMERDDFYQEVWDFVQNNKHISENGIKRMGASADWSRNTFTLDPEVVKVVYETFRKMYEDGLVYRGDRICNWCPRHQTALSDLETKYEEREDPFYYLQYGPFVIGTARPETKFGDKYVVVHPDDKRYAEYQDGQKIELEWINGPVTATIIKDAAIDMEFGTGAMTITPWHDATDFEIAQRHGLDMEQIIDKNDKLLPVL